MKDKKSPEIIKQRKLLRKSTMIIMLGIFIGAALTVLVVKQSPSIKDRYQAAPSTADALLQNLKAFKQTDSKEYIPLASPLSVGDKLALNVSVLRSTFIGLLVSVNQQKPSFEFYTRLPPGESRRIERQGKRYIYTVTDTVKSLKFCVVYAVDKKGLQQANSQLSRIWPSLPDSSCLTLK